MNNITYTVIIVIIIILTIVITIILINYEPKKDKIKLKYIKNFLTNEECVHLIDIAKDKFNRSHVLVNGQNAYENSRTSSTYFYKKSEDEIIKNIEKRISKYTNKNIETIEPLQIVKYEVGQEFKGHYDWFENNYSHKINDQRQYTIFVYLNDVEEGGETYFPKLDIKIKPKKGNAVFWEDCENQNKCHNLSFHQGLPPKKGIKYGLNIWIRFKPYVQL